MIQCVPMCGRYGFSVQNAKEVYKRFQVGNEVIDLHSRFNIAPGQMNPVIVRHSPNSMQYMFWSLIPHWAKDDMIARHTSNARAEGIENKPTFKKPIRFQRCLIPASGFYEWTKTKPAIPYYFQMKDESLFAFAGLYDVWKDPKDGQEIYSYTIITTEPNGVVSPIHHRMPVILKKEDEDFWLDPDVIEPERLLPLLRPYPSDQMKVDRVSTAVNNPRLDSEELIKPQEEELKLL